MISHEPNGFTGKNPSVFNRYENNGRKNTLPGSGKTSTRIRKKKFKSSNLNPFGVFFSNLYIKISRRSDFHGRKLKRAYIGIADHPHKWSAEPRDAGIYKKNKYDIMLSLMQIYSILFGAVFFLLSKARKFAKYLARSLASLDSSADSLRSAGYFLKKSAKVLLPLGTLIATAVIIANISSYGLAIMLYVDGEPIGVVENAQIVRDAIELVERDLSSVAGLSYKFPSVISYRLVPAGASSYMAPVNVYNALHNHAGSNITSAYGLYIDNVFIGAAADKSDVRRALSDILKINMSDDDVSIEFYNEVMIVERRFIRELVGDYDNLVMSLALLISDDLADSEAVMSLSAVSFDSAVDELAVSGSIPRDLGEESGRVSRRLSMPEGINAFYLMNVLDEDALSGIDVRLRTTRTEVFLENIQFETIYRESNSYHVGTTVVQNPGVPGQREVTALVSYLGDDVTGIEVESYIVLREPVNRVVIVGTNPRPTTTPTGTFIRPVNGQFSSGFGPRTRGSITEFHAGVDFRAPFGTPIFAADGGVVTFVGVRGGYGNFILISHGNGIETAYAHMSSMSVSVGQRVFQGEQIGRVGSTGNSTGNHLHFEVRINGVQVDPMRHLPR